MKKMQTFLDEEMRDHLQGDHARFRLVSDSDCVDQLAANTMYDQKKDVYPGEPAGQPHWHVLQPCHFLVCTPRLISDMRLPAVQAG